MFQTIFYQPILNLLVFIYNIVPGHDIGLVIIVLTLLIKLVLHPFTKKSIQSRNALQSLQPKIAELKIKHKDSKEEMSKAMMALYKEEKVSPFSSCLPLLIQLPFFFAIYQVFRDELQGKSISGLIYPFISSPGTLNAVAFGFLDFSRPNTILAILAGLSQFVQMKLMPQPPKPEPGKEMDMAGIMNKQMMYMMPGLTLIICITLPSGLAFYWLVSTVLTILQELWVKHRADKAGKGIKAVADGGVVEGEVVK